MLFWMVLSLHFFSRLLVLSCTILYYLVLNTSQEQWLARGNRLKPWKQLETTNNSTLWLEKAGWNRLIDYGNWGVSNYVLLDTGKNDIKGKYCLQGWNPLFWKTPIAEGPVQFLNRCHSEIPGYPRVSVLQLQLLRSIVGVVPPMLGYHMLSHFATIWWEMLGVRPPEKLQSSMWFPEVFLDFLPHICQYYEQHVNPILRYSSQWKIPWYNPNMNTSHFEFIELIFFVS